MNLSDFDITSYSGLYISKDSHPRFGKKYIARFQYDKKDMSKYWVMKKEINLLLMVQTDLWKTLKIRY